MEEPKHISDILPEVLKDIQQRIEANQEDEQCKDG